MLIAGSRSTARRVRSRQPKVETPVEVDLLRTEGHLDQEARLVTFQRADRKDEDVNKVQERAETSKGLVRDRFGEYGCSSSDRLGSGDGLFDGVLVVLEVALKVLLFGAKVTEPSVLSVSRLLGDVNIPLLLGRRAKHCEEEEKGKRRKDERWKDRLEELTDFHLLEGDTRGLRKPEAEASAQNVHCRKDEKVRQGIGGARETRRSTNCKRRRRRPCRWGDPRRGRA